MAIPNGTCKAPDAMMGTDMSGTARTRLLVAALWQLIGALVLASTALIQTANAQPTNIRATLLAEGPVQPGETVTLAIHMEPGGGWHGYWLNPGDAGLGMQLDWDLPPGATVGELQYPVPSTLLISGLMNHVYKGDYAVLVPFTAPADTARGSTLPIAVDAQWLACTDEVCVPEQGRLETAARIGKPERADPAFDGWRARLPAPLNADARFERTSEAIRLAIPLPAATALDAPHTFIAQDRAISYAAPQRFSRNGDLLVIEL
ncbi:MAG: thiol:disulfide interchange protein, partial [Sphingomonadaceae bacterium]|nr:thiol:disulfide interchange protein [Sphingomonadaceae bacterium]